MSKENLVSLILNNYREFEAQHKKDSNMDITEADFSGSTIEEADFTNIDFSGSSFSECNLSNIKFIDCDLTSVDFSRAQVSECDFSGSILNGTSFNYASVNYCNFTDADMAGANFSEANLEDSDFSTSENLDSCRFDEGTVWPENEKLPEDFDCTYNYDLSTLRDDEEEGSEAY